MIRPRRRRPAARPAASLLTLALLAAACSGPAPAATMQPPTGSAQTPAPTADLSTACSPASGAGAATMYPGWPPDADPEIVPIIVSTELAVGPSRLLLNLVDNANVALASPDLPVQLRLYNLADDPAQPALSVPASYLETQPGRPGLYRGAVDFPCWGEWGLEAIASATGNVNSIGRVVFPVRPTTSTPAIGGPAPASETPTATTPDEIGQISTDTQPDPDFYEVSVDQALEQRQPFLLIFATPAFCSTAACGPALDIVKSVAADFKDRVTFIHVEPYELEVVDGSLRPVLTADNLPMPVESVDNWGLPTEPYIFVVDSAGRVTAKLEGVASAEEIEQSLTAVAGAG